MTVRVRVPAPLRPYAGNASSVEVEGGTLREALDALVAAHAPLKPQLLDDSGDLRSFVNVYVNGTDSRSLDGMGTALSPGDVVLIVPSVAGG